MISNYIKIAWRNLIKHKFSAAVNIGGLAAGMAVTVLIGLWINDELSFDKYHNNYNRIALAMQNITYNGEVSTSRAIPPPLGTELRQKYGSNFKYIVMSSFIETHVISAGTRNFPAAGNFMEPDGPKLFSLKMISGTTSALSAPSSIMLSAAMAGTLFGTADPVGRTVQLDAKKSYKVTGVYQDLPRNTTLGASNMAFIGTWEAYVNINLSKESLTNWGENGYKLYVQIADNADMGRLSAKIKDIKLNNVSPGSRKYHPAIFLYPISKWHLYADFKNGIATGGRIQNVWLFGIIGIFVLLLACINFMNLSTARSEKRAKEVGIRKAVGSLRGQLIVQFYCESFVVALLAFCLAIVIALLLLPFFNDIASKTVTFPWGNGQFWLAGLVFTLFTGLIAGSYPAIYLSGFNPVKILKGTFKAGRYSATTRKALVVVQFAVSVILIIGTITVFKQIEFGKDRPVGYNRDGLVSIPTITADLHQHFAAFRNDLLTSGAVTQVAESSDAVTSIDNNMGGFVWKGKDPAMSNSFAILTVSADYGKTVDMNFTQGRDFSKDFIADSSAVLLNETAVRYMNLKKPVGEEIRLDDRVYHVVGVIRDMLMNSPYEPVKQSIFMLGKGAGSYALLRINPKTNMRSAIDHIENIYKTYSPSVPFSYKFADDEYAKKFADEERVGKLAGSFAVLAILISCLGLFGMASFVSEQRIKEIGVRKVLGASIFNLWGLLSVDFIKLIILSLFIATPVAWYFMNNWLQHFTYHTHISIWIFVITAFGAVLVTLLTVSYQSISAALTNPVKSLKTE
ncbi:ABC transporter permease [Mucilaginibacter sp. UYCu711]|uniref:ABC transporter permease n=1 Tax=Mucilaginibacter sp. UYCu711 TaxID=3156339 RepID=UPI003D22BDD1